MTSAEAYIPMDLARRFRRQAWRAWAIGLAVVAVWSALILAAPLFRATGGGGEALYSFFHYICHQMPERSFHLMGEPFGVCSRCSGVYFGLVLGFAAYPLWRAVDEIEPIARFWLFLSLIPVGIDWSLTVFGIWENTQLTRVVTGLILGFACATFIVPAIVEAARNLTYRRKLSSHV